MRASQHDLGSPVAWGEFRVTNARTLAARCDGACRGHHWGYVISGMVRVAYPDHDEMITAGDAYYITPGHRAIDAGDAELVDITHSGNAT